VEQVAQPERPSEAALFAKPKGGFGKNRGNHSQGGNGYNKQPYTDARKCFYCGKPGHFEKQCRKKKSDDAGSAYGSQHKQFGATVLTANTMACNSDGQAMRWVLDTGASRHMTSNKHALSVQRSHVGGEHHHHLRQRWHWKGHCRGGAAAAHP
jgi:hypothetical protein